MLQALLQKDSPTHIAVAQRTHTHISTLVRSLALTQSPEQSIVRLYVWVRLAAWACHNRVESDPVLVPDNCDLIFPPLRQHIDSLAAKVIDAEMLGHLDGIVARYKERHPKLLSIGLMRIDDMADHLPAEQMILERAALTMFSPVSDAAREIEQTRILGGQLVWLMRGCPPRSATRSRRRRGCCWNRAACARPTRGSSTPPCSSRTQARPCGT